MDPQAAQLQYKLQGAKNCLIIVGIFVPLAFLFAFLPFSWLFDIALIGGLFYLFFYILQGQPIKIKCPKCRNIVASNTPWACGFCKGENRNVDTFSFLTKCEHCGAEPKSYQCHHCKELMFFTEDKLAANYASCLNLNPVVTPVNMGSVRQEAIDAKKHELEIADLEAQLYERKMAKKARKPKTPEKEIEESYKKFYARHMGREDFAEHQRKLNAVKFQGDPERLKRAEECLKAWLRGAL